MLHDVFGSFRARVAMIVMVVVILACGGSAFAAPLLSSVPNPPGADLDQFPILLHALSQNDMDSLNLHMVYLKDDVWVLDRSALSDRWNARLMCAPAAVLVDARGVIRYDAKRGDRLMLFERKDDYGMIAASILGDLKDGRPGLYVLLFTVLFLGLVAFLILFPHSSRGDYRSEPKKRPREREADDRFEEAIRGFNRSLDNLAAGLQRSGACYEQPIMAPRARTVVIRLPR